MISDITYNSGFLFAKPQNIISFRYEQLRRFCKYFLFQAAILNFRVKEESEKVGVRGRLKSLLPKTREQPFKFCL